jgi:hypothetical protein
MTGADRSRVSATIADLIEWGYLTMAQNPLNRVSGVERPDNSE